jgi:flagellar motor switch protein FliN/FliY
MFAADSPGVATATAVDGFGVFAAGFFESAGAVLSAALNRRAAVEVADVETTTVSALLEARPLPWLLLEAPYARGLSGTHWLALSLPEALRFGEALLGGQEQPTALSEGQSEAIRDAVNQMLAAAGPALMPLLGRSVAFGAATVRVAEAEVPAELGAASDRLSVARAHVRADGGLEVDLLLLTGEGLAQEIASAGGASSAGGLNAAGLNVASGDNARLDLILDVTLPVTVELGRARMQIQEVLKLVPGSVIELEKLAGDPVDLYINDRPIAKGEVVIIDENFGIRLTSIVTATERIKTLR